MIKMAYNNTEIELTTTKRELSEKLLTMKNKVIEEMRNDPAHEQYFYEELIMLIARLESELERKIIFTAPEGWYYSITIDNRSACINLRHLPSTDNYEGYDESYSIVRCPVHTVSSPEYAKQHELSDVTVRQWIRRGKLRSAYKIGSDWRIPVLTEKPSRGFKNITYNINMNYVNLTQFGCFAIHPRKIQILASENKGEYYLIADGAPAMKTLDDKEREILEHLLLSIPDITNSENILINCPDIEETDLRIPTLRTGGMRL